MLTKKNKNSSLERQDANFRRKIYGSRLKIDFADNKFVFKISSAKYNNSGNYLIKVELEPYEKAVGVANAIVQGMFFSFYQ